MWKGVVSQVPLFCKSGCSDVERKYFCNVQQASLGCVEVWDQTTLDFESGDDAEVNSLATCNKLWKSHSSR
jgi:hypothetical protein